MPSAGTPQFCAGEAFFTSTDFLPLFETSVAVSTCTTMRPGETFAICPHPCYLGPADGAKVPAVYPILVVE